MHIPYGDVAALAAAVDDATAMVILEPIQGEAGVVVPPRRLPRPRPGEITARHGALLVLDEVQTGIGRTGHWFAHQAEGVAPTSSRSPRASAAGCRIGAMHRVRRRRPTLLGPGMHGSTFGGNPVCCAAALAVLDTIERERPARPRQAARRAAPAAASRRSATRWSTGSAAPGCCSASSLTEPVAAAVLAAALRDAGFLVNGGPAGRDALAPPLILTDAQADAFVAALGRGAWTRCRPDALTTRPGTSSATTTSRPAEQAEILDLAAAMKADRYAHKPLAGPRAVAVIFEKPSLRTRVSFEVGIAELGGTPLIIDAPDTHFGRGETIGDAAQGAVPLRLRDRHPAHSWTPGSRSWPRRATVPVVNALTDGFHPCQLLADLLTVRERLGGTPGRTLTYLGDARQQHGALLRARPA